MPKSVVTYREVVGFSHYRVGDDGSVWTCMMRCHRQFRGDWKRKSAVPDKDGYLRVALFDAMTGKRRSRPIHQLVLEAFIGPKPFGQICRHLDGDPANNRLGNLAWGSHAQNGEDMVRHGKSQRGEANNLAKLTKEQARLIKYDTKSRGVDLAKKFGVRPSAVCAIRKGKTWAWL